MAAAGLTPDEIRGHLATLGFSALVAGSFSLGAIVANDIAPQAITAARFVFATIVMGMVAALQRDLKPEYLCLLYTSPSPRDGLLSRMPSSA